MIKNKTSNHIEAHISFNHNLDIELLDININDINSQNPEIEFEILQTYNSEQNSTIIYSNEEEIEGEKSQDIIENKFEIELDSDPKDIEYEEIEEPIIISKKKYSKCSTVVGYCLCLPCLILCSPVLLIIWCRKNKT
ncbi:MAG: hypothetical protein GY830_02370 [Bacteroidetes bacterium]|nr:hypothetical protein [Bacteroidota bacterium]